MKEPKLLITIPATFQSERHYIIHVLFAEFLDIPFNIYVNENSSHYEITLPNESSLIIEDHFFNQFKNQIDYINSLAIPEYNQYTTNQFIPEIDIPLLYGQQGINVTPNKICCKIDIFSSCFFMLTRLEEMILTDRDNHARFPARPSFAYKSNCLDRPIVDEYVEMLWKMMTHLCPQLNRKKKQGKVIITCDVDQPFDRALGKPKQLIKSIGGDLVKRGSLRVAIKRAYNYFVSPYGNYNYDPYNTFSWYMDICEQYGHKVIFYFIPDHSAGNIDGCYSLEEPKIQELIKKIAKQGHGLGVHGSYNTYQNAEQIFKERQRMITACTRAGVDANITGNRQHYLRWDAAQTPDYLDAAGFDYDTSGSFADLPGFRYGTAKEFTMWSWLKKSPLRIKQRPLIVMECSVLSKHYMGLGYTDKALEYMMTLKKRSLKYGGNFSLLWHNSELITNKARNIFCEIIK